MRGKQQMISKSVLRLSAAAFVLAALPLSGAQAQSLERLSTDLTDTLQTAIDLLPSDVTNVRLGIGPVIGTNYEGASHYNIRPVPVISLRYRNWVEIDNNEVKLTAFSSLSAGGNVGDGVFKAGPLISLNFGRNESDDAALHGMGNVDTSFELGAFVSYTFGGGTRVRVRARQDVAGGHKGATVTTDVTQAFIRGDNFALGGFASTTWASGPYMQSFFGVTPAQSLTSGYGVYIPGSSFKDATFGLNGNYRISDRWALVADVSYERLIAKAAESPLVHVGSPNQMFTSAFIVYSF